MTARCIPEDPVFGTGRHAEEAVWRALRDRLPDDAVLMPGVSLQDGAKQREIDLLVLWPGHGIAVIEVKGGRVDSKGGLAMIKEAGGEAVRRRLAEADQG